MSTAGLGLGWIRGLIVPCSLYLATACKGDPPTVGPPPPPPPSPTLRLDITPAQETVYVGALGRLTATYWVNGSLTPLPESIIWSTNNANTATVTDAGVWYASAAGEAILTGAVGTVTGSMRIVVRDPVLTSGDLALPSAPVVDMAYDGRRNLLYLSQPDQRIAVLSPTTLSFGPPIELTSKPLGIDVTAMDRLVVALPDEDAIAEVTLADRVQLPIQELLLGYGIRKTAALRVTRDNVAFVAITAQEQPGYALRLVNIDLTTKVETTRDFPISGLLRIARSTNALRIVMRVDEVHPNPAYVYDVATKTMGPIRFMIGDGPASLSANRDGTRLLSDRVRYSQDIQPIDSATSISYISYTGSPSTISADGALGYFAVENNVVAVEFATNTIVRTFNYPAPARIILAMPNGKGLVVLTGARIYVHPL
jgi:hypothetical protein